MATTTPLLILRKPASADTVDVALDLNANYDKLDTAIGRGIATPVTLTDGTTVALNVALGRLFRLTMAGSRTLGVPSNPVDGQGIILEIVASGADRTLTLPTGAGGFIFGSDVTGPLTATVSGKTDFIGAMYRSSVNLWRVLSVSKGY